MKLTRRKWLAAASGIVATLSAGASFASSHAIKVSLWDKGDDAMRMLGHGPMMGMGAMDHDMSMMMMGIQMSSHHVSSGEVTFKVINTSKKMVHEMVISPIKDTNTPLPYDQATNRINEDAAGHLGEVAELEPGKTGVLTLTLKPGQYVLYCNVAGHYALGMWTLLTVK